MPPRLEVDLQDVADAMTSSSDDPFHYFLHRPDGAVVAVPGESFDGDIDDPEIDVHSDDYVPIPRAESREQYGVMARFAKTVDDPDVAELLDLALTGRGAFGRFRDVVSRDRVLQQRWYAYKREAEHARARAWLEGLDIDVVDVSRPPPGPTPVEPVSRRTAIGLVDLLLLGAPDGKTELLEGQVYRVVPARNAAERRALFRDLARDICAACDTPWRKRFVEDTTSFDLERFHLRLLDDRIELAIDTPMELWRRFADR